MEIKDVLFWLLCVPIRLLLLTYVSHTSTLRFFASIISIVWLSGIMDNKNVGFFGGKVWWAEERKLHGVLWALYAATHDSQWLMIDVMVAIQNKISSNEYK